MLSDCIIFTLHVKVYDPQNSNLAFPYLWFFSGLQDSIQLLVYAHSWSITMFCGTKSISRNISYTRIECGEYSMENCQSHRTLLWTWIMLCMYHLYFPRIIHALSWSFGFVETIRVRMFDNMFFCFRYHLGLWSMQEPS